MKDTIQKRTYNSPRLIVKGDIAELTQQSKTFGTGDGMILVIPDVADIPIKNYS